MAADSRIVRISSELKVLKVYSSRFVLLSSCGIVFHAAIAVKPKASKMYYQTTGKASTGRTHYEFP